MATAGRAARKGPTLRFEREIWEDGAEIVAGVDEVGRGAWAGPIAVGIAVVGRSRRLYKVRDSKQITEINREKMFDRVAGWCDWWSVGYASNQECDDLGMSMAQRLAATRAIESLGVTPDHILVDGNWNFIGGPDVTTIVRGDNKSLSIAAASILAKVSRDRLMRDFANEYPHYDFEKNKGYSSVRHEEAIARHGPSAIHRQSWAFMDRLVPAAEL